MIRRLFPFAAALTLVPASTAAAINIKKLCEQSDGGALGSVPLIYAALAEAKLTADVVDLDSDGVTNVNDWLNAMFDADYCKKTFKPNGTAICKEGDIGKLDRAKDYILGTLNLKKNSFVTNPKPEKDLLFIDILRAPTIGEIAKNPSLTEVEYGQVYAALDPKARYATLRCPAPQTQSDRGADGKQKEPFNGFRLSSTIDGLSDDRSTSSAFAKIPYAQINYTDDRIAKTKTFEIDAIAGFDLAKNPNNHAILFAGYKKKRVRSGIAQSASDSSQVNIGFNYGALLESLDEFSLASSYTFDTVQDSKIGALRATWRPGFLQNFDSSPFVTVVQAGPSFIQMDAQTILVGGHVFATGSNIELGPEADFLHVGGEIKLTTWPFVKSAQIGKFSLYTSYKHLFSISGHGDATWYTVGGNWALTEKENIALSLGYERGEDEISLTATDKWLLGLKLKF
jgi:hypothetical protein